jgi:hypothetical protein
MEEKSDMRGQDKQEGQQDQGSEEKPGLLTNIGNTISSTFTKVTDFITGSGDKGQGEMSQGKDMQSGDAPRKRYEKRRYATRRQKSWYATRNAGTTRRISR